MYIGGPIEIAGLEESASDPVADLFVGRIYYNTTSTDIRYYDGSSWKVLTTIDLSQVITNKDIDGGTASNTSRLTVPKDTDTNINALARKEATLLYASDTNKLFIDNGTTLDEVAFSVGGGSLTVDLSVGNVTVTAGNTLFHPQLTIDTGDLYTISGSLVGIGTLTVDGTLTVSGAGEVIYV